MGVIIEIILDMIIFSFGGNILRFLGLPIQVIAWVIFISKDDYNDFWSFQKETGWKYGIAFLFLILIPTIISIFTPE